MSSRVLGLILGDGITLVVVTLFGFATHGTLGTAGQRMLTTFVPLLVAWLLIGPHLRVFDMDIVEDARHLWRPFWAMILAAPMAAFLRGILLGSPILPIFVVVLGGISAIAILAWRGGYLLWISRTRRLHG